MKDEIINIINLEKITKVRTSLAAQPNIPAKNSLVKLIPLEYMNHGVKVLIDGKLFIAAIDDRIPLREELIASVSNRDPFSLSLNLLPQLKKNEELLVSNILKKLNLSAKSSFRKFLPQIIKEECYVIKSKIVILDELMKDFKTEGLEFSLLINLIWNSNNNTKHMIKELYDNLFNESFEQVCEKLFQSFNGLLFSVLPQHLIQKMADTLIYDEKKKNLQALLNKSERIYELIKNFNDHSIESKKLLQNHLDDFTRYGSKYILQKSVLKDYDYFPDFVIASKGSELILILYNIKRAINVKGEKFYKIIFKNDVLPFNLQGILRENFLDADIKVSEIDNVQNEINVFKENLYAQWGFRSEVKIKNRELEDYYLSQIDSEVNKLIS